MKHLKYIIMSVALILFFSSCEMNIEKVKLAPNSEFKAPTLSAMANVIINADNVSSEGVIFNWTDANFGAPVQVEYSLYTTFGTDTALVGTSFSNSLSISKQDFNGIACNEIKVTPNTTGSVKSFLVARVYGTNAGSIKSNDVAYSITTYKAPLRPMYMPGAYQGWKVEKANEFWETNGGTNVYNTLIDLKPSDAFPNDNFTYFKVTSARNWSEGNWGKSDITQAWTGFDAGAGDLSIDIAGGKTTKFILSFNKGNMTISKKDISKVSIIGAFNESNGWSNDVDFTYDPLLNVWATTGVTFAAGKLEFLVRLNGSWDDKYGGGGNPSFDVAGGLELVKGGSNLAVPSAGTYIMKLYGNRTPFVIVMEKQ